MYRIVAFLENSWISFRALFRYFDPVAYISTQILMPLGLLITFTLLGVYATGPKSASFYLVGNAIVVVAVNGISGMASTLGEERALGTLPFLLAAPRSRLLLLLERAFCNIFDGLLTVAVAFFFGWAFFGLDFSHANALALICALLVASFSTACFGMVIGVLAMPMRDIVVLMSAAFLVLLALAGVNFPVQALPLFLQPISWALPLTRSIIVARAALSGASLTNEGPLLVQEVALGLAYWFLAWLILSWMERAALNKGELESV